MFDLGKFIQDSKRIFVVSRKPSWNEFKTMCKVTGIGIVLIAVVGFIVDLLFKLFKLGV